MKFHSVRKNALLVFLCCSVLVLASFEAFGQTQTRTPTYPAPYDASGQNQTRTPPFSKSNEPSRRTPTKGAGVSGDFQKSYYERLSDTEKTRFFQRLNDPDKIKFFFSLTDAEKVRLFASLSEQEQMKFLGLLNNDDRAKFFSLLNDEVKVFPVYKQVQQVVYLEGHVKYPREYELKRGMKLRDLIPSYDGLLPEPHRAQAEIVCLVPPDQHPDLRFL